MKHIQSTSRLSYRQTVLMGQAQTYRNLCQLYLSAYSATDGEAMKALGIKDPNLYRPERTRLYQDGKLERLPKRICKVSGRLCYVWRVRR